MEENTGLSASDIALLTDRNGGGGMNWGDSSFLWIFALLILANGGFGGNWGGGGGNSAGGSLPYFYNAQTQNDVNRGFSDLHLSDQISALQGSVTSGFSDTQLGIAGLNQSICQASNNVINAVNNGFTGVEASANARQIANMQQAFASQAAMSNGFSNLASQLAQCCCDNRLATCQTQNVIQSESAATRFADATNTRDIIDTQTRGTQAILDKLCQLELDGVKAQLDAKNDRIAELTTQLNMANLNASQTAQTAQILSGQVNEIDAMYNRLKNCPVPSMPVYGNTPIFTCGGNGCGCGNNINI